MNKITIGVLWLSVGAFFMWGIFGVLVNILWVEVLAFAGAIVMVVVTLATMRAMRQGNR